MKYYLIALLLTLTGCSLKTPPNEWQYKSANAFSSYTKNFLSDNSFLATNDFQRAQKHAKSSADLTQLATIHLGKCALHISVGIEDRCEQYKEIQNLLKDKELDAYYRFIQKSLKIDDIEYLPKHYQAFAEQLTQKNFDKANDAILQIQKPISRLLCASLIKEQLNSNVLSSMIELSSYNGYKKAVLFWLEQTLHKSNDREEKAAIRKTISLLKSPN